jgi:hypothetical protein
MFPRLLKLFILSMVCVLFTGCASVTGSKLQPVSVSSTCESKPVNDASCTLTNDKGSWFVKTPGSVTVNKAYGDITIECKKDEMKGSSTFKSSSEGAVWGNIIAGGGIGFLVDANTGAGFAYPNSMTVNMSGTCPDQ